MERRQRREKKEKERVKEMRPCGMQGGGGTQEGVIRIYEGCRQLIS